MKTSQSSNLHCTLLFIDDFYYFHYWLGSHELMPQSANASTIACKSKAHSFPSTMHMQHAGPHAFCSCAWLASYVCVGKGRQQHNYLKLTIFAGINIWYFCGLAPKCKFCTYQHYPTCAMVVYSTLDFVDPVPFPCTIAKFSTLKTWFKPKSQKNVPANNCHLRYVQVAWRGQDMSDS